MTRALPRVALQAWIVLFIVFFGAEVIHLEPGLRVLTQLAYGVPLAAWAAWRLRGPADLLDAAVLILLALYAVVSLLSADRTESLGTLGLAAAYAAWFLLMRREAGSSLRGSIVAAVAIGLVITLAFNAYLLVQEKINWFATLGAAPFEGVMTFPWESVNALPILVLLALPFVGWLDRSPARTAIGAVVFLTAVVVVPLSLGRAGWLGLGLAAVAAVVFAAHGRMTRGRWLTGIAAVGVAGVGAAVLVGPRLLSAIGESGRLLLWEQGLAMVRASPWVGAGPGTYSWMRLDFPPDNADLLAVRLIHSAPLQALVDGGVLLLLGIIGAGVVLFAAVLRRGPLTLPDRVAAACVVGYLAALTLDDFSYLPAITAVSLTAVAFLVPVNASPARTPLVRWTAPAIIAAAAALALPGVMSVDQARAAAQEARTAMAAGEFASAIDSFRAATAAHSENGGYWLGLGMAASYADDRDLAIRSYQRAVDASPGDPRGYAALAALQPRGPTDARLTDAADRTLGDPQFAIRLGIELAATDDVHDATHAWARAVALRPAVLGELPFDDAGTGRDDVAEEAILILQGGLRASDAETMAATWDILLGIDALPADAGLAWQAVDVARHGDLEAGTELADLAIARAGYEARGFQARAAVAAFACDEDAERQALELEALAVGAHGSPPDEVEARREFVYREAGLGATEPRDTELRLELERWPWPFIDQPRCP